MPSSNLADLIRQRGRNAAEAELRRGEISQRMWSGIGDTISNTLGSLVQYQMDEPVRAEQAELRRLQLEKARRDEADATTVTRQDAAFADALAGWDGDPDTLFTVSQRIYGPRRGAEEATKIWDGYQKLSAPIDPKDEAARMTLLRDLARPILQLPAEAQGPAYTALQQYAKDRGWSDVPDAFDPATLQRFATYGEAPPDPLAVQKAQREDMEAMERIAATNRDDRRQADSAEETARHNRVMEARTASQPRSPIWVQDKAGNFVDLAGVAPPGSTPASSREQGRPVTSGDANRIADFDTSLDDIGVLRTTLSETKDATGTAAAIGANVPPWATDMFGWGTDAKKRQGVIDRVKQVIGKALEGGVLRKEDEYKYEKILPTIKDTPVVAASKLRDLEAALRQRRSVLLSNLEDAGYDTSKFPTDRTAPAPDLSGLKSGFARKFSEGPFAGQEWAVDEAGVPYRVK